MMSNRKFLQFKCLLLSLLLIVCLTAMADEFEITKKAAERGDAVAQLNLGVIYDNGEGMPEDDVHAYAWYSIAAAQGNELAKKNKEKIATDMSRDQIAEAQKLSREFWESYGPGREDE